MGKIVVGVGELLWDVFPEYRKAGGAPPNFVYHASRQGAEGYVISAVGDDAYGTEILQQLDANNIARHIETVGYPTGRALVALRDGQPTFDIVADVAWDHIPLSKKAVELVGNADAISFGTLAQRSPVSRATISALLGKARRDALRVFDVNLRQNYYSADLIDQSLRLSNVFKVNDDELAILKRLFAFEGNDDEICNRFITNYNLLYMILTAGGVSSTVYTADDKSFLPTPVVEVADTVGAGDAFSGAFVCSILQGDTFREAHRRAVDVAARVCTMEGAWV
jgi:fructokinase